MAGEAGRAVVNTGRVLAYSLTGAAGLLILSLIPGLNLLAGPLWLAFNAWLVALEYHDFPLGARRMGFPEQRRVLGQRRALALGFGAAGVVALAIPGINLLAMPAAVIGATHLAHERLPLPAPADSGG
jgi:CysZ protein